MKEELKFIAKIREVGSKDNPSYSITIDKESIKKFNLKKGDIIIITGITLK